MSESYVLTIPSSAPVPHGYFRSKLFSTQLTSNPLIAAASPLLSLLERLCVSPTLPEVDMIRQSIEHELFAFQSRLTFQKYPEENMKLAYYLLCATIDELIGKNYLRLYNEPAEFKAFTPSSQSNVGPEQQFFIIVTHLKERVLQYLDVLELAYYCLIAGFEGQFHVKADGRQALDNLIDELHQLILQHRAHQKKSLFPEHHALSKEVSYHKRFISFLAIAVTILALTYLGSNSLLERQAKTLMISHFSSE